MDLPLDPGQLRTRCRLAVCLLAPQPIIFLLVGRHELVDQLGLQQIVLQAPQHGVFQHVSANGQPIVAGPPIAGVGAAIMPRADQRVAAAAGAAGEQAGEQVMRPARALGSYPTVAHYGLPRRRLARFHARPQGVADDAQGRDLFDDPFPFRVWSRLAANHLGVLDEPLTVPDETADVELVVQDAGAASPVAVDRRRPPGVAARPEDASVVQVLRDRPGALAGREIGEDATHDIGFVGGRSRARPSSARRPATVVRTIR